MQLVLNRSIIAQLNETTIELRKWIVEIVQIGAVRRDSLYNRVLRRS